MSDSQEKFQFFQSFKFLSIFYFENEWVENFVRQTYTSSFTKHFLLMYIYKGFECKTCLSQSTSSLIEILYIKNIFSLVWQPYILGYFWKIVRISWECTGIFFRKAGRHPEGINSWSLGNVEPFSLLKKTADLEV